MAKLLIIYDSPTGNTEKMAEAVAEGARSIAGIEVIIKYFAKPEEMAEADAIIFGVPTYNHDMTIPLKQLLEEVAKSKVKLNGKLGAAFGSYGWSGEAPSLVLEILNNKFRMNTISPVLNVLNTPNPAQLEECKKMGKRIAEKMLTK